MTSASARARASGLVVVVLGLHPGEGVERRHQRQVELVLDARGRPRRQPVVGVDGVGGVISREAVEHAVGELVDERRASRPWRPAPAGRRARGCTRKPGSTCDDRRAGRGDQRGCTRRRRRRPGRAPRTARARTRSCRHRRRCPAGRAATCAARGPRVVRTVGSETLAPSRFPAGAVLRADRRRPGDGSAGRGTACPRSRAGTTGRCAISVCFCASVIVGVAQDRAGQIGVALALLEDARPGRRASRPRSAAPWRSAGGSRPTACAGRARSG